MKSTNRNGRRGEAGYVLIIVLLLIIMFTGLGVLAMRHTRQELQSAGAYLDATQAADLVKGALALVATDLRVSSDYYEFQFLSSEALHDEDAGTDEATYEIPLNPDQFTGAACTDTDTDTSASTNGGCIGYLSSPGVYSSSALQPLYGVDITTAVKQEAPEVGPCPPGFSCFDDQNYGWYTFTVDATASYGSQHKSSTTLFELGRAEGKGRMTVGPISVFGR